MDGQKPKTRQELQKEREAELDRFWSIDELLPKKRPAPPVSRNTEATEVILEPQADRQASAVRELPLPKRTAPAGEQLSMSELPVPPEPPIPPEPPVPPAPSKTVVHSTLSAGNPPVLHRRVDPARDRQLANAPAPDEEYSPQSALIHRVRIYRWRNQYNYYEDFTKQAEVFLPLQGSPCVHTPFFSYVPQYSQMDRSQTAWYLWLRECIRRGEAPDTDYSYLLLYIYEIINLSNRIDPAKGRAQLLHIWSAYRTRFVRLDSCLPDWICDYSLIHRLPPPEGLATAELSQLMAHSGLKEFYVGGERGDGYVQALIVFCCNYDYRKSKFRTEETAKLFDRAVLLAVHAVTEHLSREGKLFSRSGMDDIRLMRDAYSGALCSYRIKRKLEISYCSFSRSHELRFLITDVVKYTENRLRAHLGVRARLSVYALPIPLRELIDAVTASLLPQKQQHLLKKAAPAEPAPYEKLYDLPRQELSFANAAEIERASWDTTQRLVEAFAEESEREAPAEPAEAPKNAPAIIEKNEHASQNIAPAAEISFADAPSEGGELSALLRPYRDFLQGVLHENASEQRAAADALGKLPDAVADRINELAADLMGDILLEDVGSGYAAIDDYRTIIEELL